MTLLHVYFALLVVTAIAALAFGFARERKRREKLACLQLLEDLHREADDCGKIASSGSTLVMQLADLKAAAIGLEKQFERGIVTGAPENDLNAAAVNHLWCQLLASKLSRAAQVEIERLQARQAAVGALQRRLERLSTCSVAKAISEPLAVIREGCRTLGQALGQMEHLLFISAADVDQTAEKEVGRKLDSVALVLLDPTALLDRLKSPVLARQNIQRCLILKRAQSILKPPGGSATK